ncbi:DUF3040 domain-containing protein [Kibdelosporangium lantanae]|uniref:DUF3040 domain-containing protein n=1 Tax=Kibdelosporangium lantanae TaxID=1497396 RepID=A0ABW3MQ22_9PSEU
MNDDEVQRRLRRMERECAREDPQWTARMGQDPGRGRHGLVRRLTVDMMGCVFLVIGATASAFFVFFIGVLVLTVGACQHVEASRKRMRR